MSHKWTYAIAAIVVGMAAAAPTLALEPLSDRTPSLTLGPEEQDSEEAGIGALIPDQALAHLSGGTDRLYSLGGDKGTVIVVRDPVCPVSRRYGPRVAELARAYQLRGFTFLFLYLNENLSLAALHADKAALSAPGWYVAGGAFELAERLGVESTGDVFVLDAQYRLRFRGAVDDQYGLGYTKEAPTQRYLRNALDAVMQGRPVAIPAISSPGCFIDADPAKDSLMPLFPADGVLS